MNQLMDWILQKFEVRKLIKKLSKTKAIIISTHILDEVPEVCNKCLIINDGQKVFEEPQHNEKIENP